MSDTVEAAAPAGRIAVGLAGWSYPDWEGWVYPAGLKDKLGFVAGFVDVLEVNSTFYRPPDARTTDSWVRRTEAYPDFRFTAKLHQDVTHGGRIAGELVKAFRDGMAPLRDAGRLTHLLAQFRYDFADTPDTREHLRRIRETFGGLANLTLELRHVSWQSPETLEYLGTLDCTVANLDYPLARNSFSLPLCAVGAHAYLRLHGRNAEAWFSKGSGRDETYNYLYNDQELAEIVERAVKLAGMSKSLTLVANNHYQGKEMVNALQALAKLRDRKVRVPPMLLARYPQLRLIASNADEESPGQPALF